jgi:hypothetical protein
MEKSLGAISTWWSVNDVAAYLDISQEQARDLVVHGPLRGSWIGDELKVHDSDLARLRFP